LKKRIGRSLATLGRIIKVKLAWPCWLDVWLSGDKGRWLSIGQLVVETSLVDCRKGHERYSRSYASAIAETCHRGTVEQNCRTELSNIAVEQRGFERQGCWSSAWLFVVAAVVVASSLRRLSLRQRLLIVALLSSVTFDRDDRCCGTAEDCVARLRSWFRRLKRNTVCVCLSIGNGGAHRVQKQKKRCCGASAIVCCGATVVAGEQTTRKAGVAGERTTRQMTGCVDAADTSHRIKRALEKRRRYNVDLVGDCRAVLLYSSRG
jgi:hypothetical protein